MTEAEGFFGPPESAGPEDDRAGDAARGRNHLQGLNRRGARGVDAAGDLRIPLDRADDMYVRVARAAECHG